MNVIKKIIDHRHEIVAIRIDGVCYDVDYINTDIDYTDLVNDDVIVKAYLIENNMLEDYEFTVADLKNSDVKLYKFVEV